MSRHHKPTPLQAKALRYLWDFQRTHGYPPTLLELATGLDRQYVGSGQGLMNRLVAAGYVTVLRREKVSHNGKKSTPAIGRGYVLTTRGEKIAKGG